MNYSLVRHLCWFFLTAAGLASLGAKPADWPVTGEGLTPDPAWTWGRLDNGLRYAVRKNAQPSGQVSFRFAVETGFAHEGKEEHGLAHFVEHMAFNGTTHFPGESLSRELEKLGVATGPELSAFTFLSHTLYLLDCPAVTPAKLDRCFTVLRGFADGMQFDSVQVRRELGIVASEIRDRQSPGSRIDAARRRFLYPLASLNNAVDVVPDHVTSAKLRQFYDKWYRPERMILIVAGDADAEQLGGLVRQHFESLRARAFPAPVFDPGFIANPVKATTWVAHEPKQSGFGVEITSVLPRTEADSMAERRQWAGRNLLLYMLNARLGRLVLANPGRLQSLRAAVQLPTPFSIETTVGYFGPTSDWLFGVSTLDQELRRAFGFTFTSDEIREAKAAFLNGAEQKLKTSKTPTSVELTGWLMQEALWNYVATTPAAELELTREWLAQISPREISESWRSLWQASRASFFGYGFFPPVNGAQLLDQAFAASGEREVSAQTTRSAITFAYPDFGPPVAPARREHLADLDIDLLEFPNGVRVNLKHTNFEAATVYLSARLGRGQQTEPSRPGVSALAGGSLLNGALGRHSPEDLRRVLAASSLKLNFSVQEDTFAFGGQAGRDDFPRLLEVLTAYLTDPGWNPESFNLAATQLGIYYGDLKFTPEGAIAAEAFQLLTGNDPRYATPSPADIKARTLSEVKAWLEPELRSAPLEIGLVGDFDPDTMIDLLSRTVGALPTRRPEVTAPRPVAFVHAAPDRQLEYAGEANRGGIEVVWPLARCDEVRTSRAFQIVAAIMTDRLHQRVREDLGATYSPSVNYWKSEVDEAHGYLMAYLTVAPKDMRRIRKLMIEIADDFARKGASPVEFEQARQPILSRALVEQQANAYWFYHIMPRVQSRPDVRTWPATRTADFQSLTVTEINALAKDFLPSRRAIAVTAAPTKK